jgi:hypothetical protein
VTGSPTVGLIDGCMLCICRCGTAVAIPVAVYEFTLKTKPREQLSRKTGTVLAETQAWARTVRFQCLSVDLNVILTHLLHSLWNYQRTRLHQLCVLLTLLHSLVQLIISSDQISCEKVVKDSEGLDNVLPGLSISQDSRCVSLGQGKKHVHLLEWSSRYP